MKVYGGIEVQLHLFLTSVLHGGEPPASLAKEVPFDYGARWTPEAIWTLWRRNKLFPQSDLEI
jgi:hypothetical protein